MSTVHPFSRTTRLTRAALTLTAFALATPLALSGCASTPAAPETQHSSQSAGETEAGAVITIADAWAKASATDMHAGEGMTGVFAELTNHSDEDLVIIGLESNAAGMIELHEVVDGEMRKIQGDVTIPAGGTLTLEPGGNHIMLMDMSEPLLPGDDVVITLTLSDGTSVTLTALVKDTSGANESYGDLAGDHNTDDGEHADH